MELEYEVRVSRQTDTEWVVEAINANVGESYKAVFSGNRASERAEEYFYWKQGLIGGVGTSLQHLGAL